MIIQALIVAAAVGLDRMTKIWMTDFLTGHGGYFTLWPKVFNLFYVENTGAAFGMLKDARWFFVVMTSIVIIIAIIYSIRSRKITSWLFKISIAMIIGGAIGNLIDRVMTGVVIDFFYFELINFAVFNVADSFVTVGAVLLGIYIIFFYDKDEKKMLNRDEE